MLTTFFKTFFKTILKNIFQNTNWGPDDVEFPKKVTTMSEVFRHHSHSPADGTLALQSAVAAPFLSPPPAGTPSMLLDASISPSDISN